MVEDLHRRALQMTGMKTKSPLFRRSARYWFA